MLVISLLISFAMSENDMEEDHGDEPWLRKSAVTIERSKQAMEHNERDIIFSCSAFWLHDARSEDKRDMGS